MSRVVCAECQDEGREGCFQCGLLRPPRWDLARAEDLPAGATVRYAKPPQVAAPFGTVPFVAPGVEGTVIDVSNGCARVRFQFFVAGVTGHSLPLAVIAGQACEVLR